jgi:hypothetical protein
MLKHHLLNNKKQKSARSILIHASNHDPTWLSRKCHLQDTHPRGMCHHKFILPSKVILLHEGIRHRKAILLHKVTRHNRDILPHKAILNKDTILGKE